MSIEIKIGSPVWYYDRDFLHVEDVRRGRGCWRELRVDRETTRSWVLSNGWKVEKRNPHERQKIRNYGHMYVQLYWSFEMKEQANWIMCNRKSIIHDVTECLNYDKLKRIHEILSD